MILTETGDWTIAFVVVAVWASVDDGLTMNVSAGTATRAAERR
jgi:hypothetical protein